MTIDHVETPESAGGARRSTERQARGRRFWQPLVVLAVALVVAALGSWLWWDAAHDDDISVAEERDAVLIAGREHIETLNSLDYRKVQDGLDDWSKVTTGLLHDQFAKVGAEQRKLLADQKKISAGKVVDAAVLTLDGRTATVIAAVEISVTEEGAAGEPTVKRNRFAATMRKVGAEWKLENLQQVAVTTS